MGIVVNPLRGRLGCKIFWRLLVPYWNDDRMFRIQRFNVYLVGLFLWMFRFVTRISRKRLRFFIVDWLSAIVSFSGDICVVYFELFDYANYRRLVKNVTYDRWLKRNVELLDSIKTVMLNSDGDSSIMMQKVMNKIFWLIRLRLYMASYHGSFRIYFRYIFNILRKPFNRISRLFGINRLVIKLMPIMPMKWTTAYLIGIWCAVKVEEGFKPNRILTRVVAGCKNIRGLEGFKICVTGRFTRRQASTFSWLAGGQSGSGFFLDKAQYASVSGVSQFGSFSIKIWLRYV